jgi:GlpG protein
MRELHRFADERPARRLATILTAKSLPASVEREDDAWVVWIRNDDDRAAARGVLEVWLNDPEAPEFAGAEQAARLQTAMDERAAQQRRRLRVNIQDRWNGVWYACYPFTVALTVACIVVAVFGTDWQSGGQGGLHMPLCNRSDSAVVEAMLIQPPTITIPFPGEDARFFGRPDLPATLRRGEVWRPFTPMLLHFSLLHIFFNLIWLQNLGRPIEYLRGTKRFLPLVLVLSGVSNTVQLYWSGPLFGGMSGVVFGLIGYAWIRGRTQPHMGIGMSPNQVVYSILWMLLCIAGAFGGIANAAHVSGLLTGMVIGGRQALAQRVRGLFVPRTGDPEL